MAGVSMTASAEILLFNGRIRFDTGQATALAVGEGRVVAVGLDSEIMRLATHETTLLDCEGRTVIPGIVDAHCHVLASAATSRRVDCRPAAVGTVDALVAALRQAAPGADGWVRGYGYDDSPVGLGRHLDRRDLDRVSAARPVRVEHRSGHACALNSRALASVGIDRHTSDPPGGVIVRDADGEPTGLMLEMSHWLRQRRSESAESAAGATAHALRAWCDRMLSYGITGVTDAGPDNDLDRWEHFNRVVEDGTLPLRLTMMVGRDHMEQVKAAGLSYGSTCRDDLLRVGHAKIILTASTGELVPHLDQLAKMVAQAHALGFPVAIHAVEREAVVAASLAIGDAPPISPGSSNSPRDRIEHCGECPPDVLELVAESGALVAPNPGFLYYEGERYVNDVDADLLPHLYPVGALANFKVPTVLGSDSPVVEPNPWASIAASVTRRSASGTALGGVPVGSVADALALHSARACIAAGVPADLAVVEPDPLAIPAEQLPVVRSVATLVAGRLVWRDGVA